SELGDWIERNHKRVAVIAEKLGVDGWKGVQGGHGHLTSNPAFAEEGIKEFHADVGMTDQERAIREQIDNQRQPYRKGSGTGGGTGGTPPAGAPPDEHSGSGATGGGHTGGGTPPAEPHAKTPTSTADTEKIIQEIATDVAKYNKEVTEMHKGAKSGGDAKTGLQQAKAKEGEGNALVRRLIDRIPALRGVKGATTKEILANSLTRLKQVPTVGNVGSIVLMLQNAYGLAECGQYIFQARSFTAGVQRTMDVGVEVAKGTVEWELVMLVTRGNPIGAGIYYGGKILIGEKDESAKQKRQRLKKRAIGHMLEQMNPKSPAWVIGSGE